VEVGAMTDPDPYDQEQDPQDLAAALLGQDDHLPDEVEQVVAAALDCLANAQILREQGDDEPAQRWEDTAREILADDLTPADVIEVLLPYLCEVAEVRASALLASVPDGVPGGGR
jgi:hypothetical protein